MKGSGYVRKRPNVAGIAWLVFVGLAAAAAQSLPLVQTLWLEHLAATTRQDAPEAPAPSISPSPASHAAGNMKPDSTEG